MKSIFSTSVNIRLAMSLTLGLCLGELAWSKPSIQTIDVSPNPLSVGQAFTITVTASADVTFAAASRDLHLFDHKTGFALR